MNVNAALGVDLFDNTVFPIAAEVKDNNAVEITHSIAVGKEVNLTLTYDDAAEYIKEVVNAW